MDKKVYHILRGNASIILYLFRSTGRRNCMVRYEPMYKGFIFKNRFDTVYRPQTINRAIKRIVRDINAEEETKAKQMHREPLIIRDFSAHNLRHTFCTRFCENETNLKVIQEIMGHSDISVTMNIYAEATKDKKAESFSSLEGKIKIN